ncbi:MlaC/ttg2D family ABC transporter substrate-binding protein [Frigidibacter sp. ROC022]|uniref:MlaC/ttg2D family ABC transporter substrate-binding protein n=1 Tax=Frigidibacter sp. ROC022 TaxID=2971796 RepID=UPI00215AEDBA|nr:ABC transporter substrate-binding protein [Frigidibacter sp. ROC022]MCR8724869.1 ABC transporter substrate-binding protein [Frigidibacter sp. ROC022]
MTLTSRRQFLTATSAAVLVAAVPLRAMALTTQGAADLVGRVVADINAVINSGKSERQMYGDFARIFNKYADVSIIASSVLGASGRTASAAQKSAFTKAFIGYISRKYGKRFREFIGGKVVVKSARPIKSNFEVKTTAILKGEAPFEVIFLVSNKSGRDLFYDMLIEGVSLLRSERTEIGAMIDRRGGNLDAMIKDLAKAG